jgi:hypothetical protein
MKTLMSICLLTATILTLSSCNKKDAQDFYNTYSNKMTATVNTSTFTATNVNPQKNGNQLTITGSDGTKVLTVAIPNYTGAIGTFSVNGSSGTAIAAYNGGTGGGDAIGTSGTVTITKVDATTYSGGSVIEASFNFNATSGSTTYNVTAGTFSVFLIK